MADYNISAEITADTSGFEAGVKKAQKSSKSLGTSLSGLIKGMGKSGLVGALGAVGLATGGVTAIIGVATKAFKAVKKAVDETTEAYKTQYKAELALETVAKNNPYIDGIGVQNLKKFASELQKVSNYGDEELLPLMTNLTALGRTEEETMKIMSVAMDMASTGTMSLDTAVNQLNATLNGNIGRLGQQNAELKGLTEEELKSGRAVEILGEKFKGLSEATADSSKLLKNAVGDFKEIIGETFNKPKEASEKFFASLLGNLNSSISKARDLKKAMAEVFTEEGDVNLTAETSKLKTALNSVLDEYRTVYSNYNQYIALYGQYINKETDATAKAYRQRIKELESDIKTMSEELDKRHRETEAQAQARKEAEEQAEAEKKIADLKDEYLKKLDEQERKWQHIKEVTGEEVSAQEKIKFYQDSLVDLMTQANGQITTNNQLYKDQLKIIEQLQSTISPEEQGTSNTWIEKIRQQAIERLQAEKEAYDETVDLEKTSALERYLVRKDYNQKIFALQKEQLLAERERAMESVKGVKNEAEEKLRINEYYNVEMEKLAKSYSNTLEVEGTEAGTSFAEGFGAVLTGIKVVMSKAITLIKNMVKSIKPILTKIFSFNIDDALDNLLVFEDKILTFFVETLPQLPSFLASALQSVSVLIQSIASSGGFMNLANILISMADTLMTEVPKIAKALYPVLESILSSLFKILMSNVPNVIKMITTVVKKISQKLPQVVKVILPAIMQIVNEIIKALPSILTSVLPALLQTVLEMIKALLQNLPTIIKTIVEVLPQLIFGVVNAIADFIANLKAEDFVAIVTGIIKAVATLGVSLVKAIPQILKGLWELAKGLVKGMWNLIVEALKATWKGLKWVLDLVVDWFKDTFGGYATGTNNAQKGYALVGEQGPELVKFNGGEKVYNATNTQKMLAGATSGNAGNTFNVTFNNLQDTSAYAMMSQLRQYNRSLAINGVI